MPRPFSDAGIGRKNSGEVEQRSARFRGTRFIQTFNT